MQSAKAGSGFAPELKADEKKHADYQEDDDQATYRHQMIMEGLVNFAASKEPADFTSLQELSLDEKYENGEQTVLNKIPEMLAKHNYACVGTQDEIANGQGRGKGIILYNQAKFEREYDTEQDTQQFTQKNTYKNRTVLEGVKATFRSRDNNNEKITVLSVHAAYKVTPEEHEAAIKKFIDEHSKFGKVVIIGDFNFPIASLDATPKNITTSVSAPLVSKYNVQGAHFIDGAFYFDPANPDILQLEVFHLNPATGIPYPPKELVLLREEELINELKDKNNNSNAAIIYDDIKSEEVNRLRLIICADKSYSIDKIIDNHTIFEYQAELREIFNNDMILVRRAANLNNEKGIGIRVPRELHNLFKRACPDLQCSIIRDYATQMPTDFFVLAYDNQIAALVKAVTEIRQDFDKLAQPLKQEEAFRASIAESIVKLISQVFTTECQEVDKNNIEHLIQLRSQIINKRDISISSMLVATKTAITYLKPSTETISLGETKRQEQVINLLNGLISEANKFELATRKPTEKPNIAFNK